jgi:hypothetical protein
MVSAISSLKIKDCDSLRKTKDLWIRCVRRIKKMYQQRNEFTVNVHLEGVEEYV